MIFVYQEMKYNLSCDDAKSVNVLATDHGDQVSLHFSGYALGGGCTLLFKKHDTERIEALEKLVHLLKGGIETCPKCGKPS